MIPMASKSNDIRDECHPFFAGNGYPKAPLWTSYRIRLAILCCVGFSLTFTHRTDLSLAMVCMVGDTVTSNATKSSTHNTSTDTRNNSDETQRNYSSDGLSDEFTELCPAERKTKRKHGGPFEWSKELQGIMLGAFFWGYLVFQIPGGWMARRFGAKRIITSGILPVSILNITTPWCARASPYLLIANRALSGLGHSMIYPASQFFFSKWCPPEEKSRILSFVFGGCLVGTAITFPISGVLCDYGVDGGWPSIFYLLGGLGVIWSFVWMLYAHDSPAETPRLDPAERQFLEVNVPTCTSNNKDKTPWISILLSVPAWALMVCHFTMNYGLFMMLTQLPTYMNEVLKLEIMSNGLFLALPYLSMFISTTIGGYISDKMIKTCTLSKMWTRRIIAIIGFIVPAVLLVVMGTFDCTQQTPAVITLILLVGFSGLQLTCVVVNYTDIAGQFVGVLYGFGNLVGALSGIVAPYLVSALTPNKTREEWMITFIIASCTYVLGALLYCTLTKFETQPWAKDTRPPESGPNENGMTEENRS